MDRTEDLALLAERINAAHHRVVRKNEEAVAAAIEAGNLLKDAKRRAGHGHWIPWVTENFDGSLRTAQVYMRIARHPEDAQRIAHLGLAAVADRLADREARRKARRESWKKIPPYKKSVAAQVLRDRGRQRKPWPRQPSSSPWVSLCPCCGHDLYASLASPRPTEEDAGATTSTTHPRAA